MPSPNRGGTGGFNGPFSWFVIQDDSSYYVGSSVNANAGTFISSQPVGGMITAINVMDPTNTSTAHLILSVDGSSGSANLYSSLLQVSAFTVMNYPLNIPFTTGFNIHNSSTSGHSFVSYFTQG